MSPADVQLFKAIHSKDLEAFIKAIEAGANIRTKNYYGQTVTDIAKR